MIAWLWRLLGSEIMHYLHDKLFPRCPWPHSRIAEGYWGDE